MKKKFHIALFLLLTLTLASCRTDDSNTLRIPVLPVPANNFGNYLLRIENYSGVDIEFDGKKITGMVFYYDLDFEAVFSMVSEKLGKPMILEHEHAVWRNEQFGAGVQVAFDDGEKQMAIIMIPFSR